VATPAWARLRRGGAGCSARLRVSASDARWKPLAVRIPYRYRFTLKEVAKPAAEIAPPTVGNLGGEVRVAGMDAPVAAADVVGRGADGKEHSTTTDESGKWTLEGLLPGSYRIRSRQRICTHRGNRRSRVGEATGRDVPPGARGEGHRGHRDRHAPSTRSHSPPLSTREMSRIPDFPETRFIASELAGRRASAGGRRPPLIVRGSAPQDTAYYVDGATVPIIYHFFVSRARSDGAPRQDRLLPWHSHAKYAK